jgi:hypothetical protein
MVGGRRQFGRNSWITACRCVHGWLSCPKQSDGFFGGRSAWQPMERETGTSSAEDEEGHRMGGALLGQRRGSGNRSGSVAQIRESGGVAKARTERAGRPFGDRPVSDRRFGRWLGERIGAHRPRRSVRCRVCAGRRRPAPTGGYRAGRGAAGGSRLRRGGLGPPCRGVRGSADCGGDGAGGAVGVCGRDSERVRRAGGALRAGAGPIDVVNEAMGRAAQCGGGTNECGGATT